MVELGPSALADWESFYVIVGSSAAALTGLNFVVVALGSEKKALAGPAELSAFGTPTMVHFCAVLLLAGIISAPWPTLSSVATSLAVCAVAGLAYAARVVRQARRQTGYKPELEDWIWHIVFPFVAYGALLAGAVMLWRRPEPALFIVAATALLLTFVGIHNAWDSATWIAIQRGKE